MNETFQIITAVLFLILVYLGTRMGITWRVRRAGLRIAKDLQKMGALSPGSAKELPYMKKSMLHLGMRDFRPKAMEALVEAGIVVQTEEGRFYLADTSLLDL